MLLPRLGTGMGRAAMVAVLCLGTACMATEEATPSAVSLPATATARPPSPTVPPVATRVLASPTATVAPTATTAPTATVAPPLPLASSTPATSSALLRAALGAMATVQTYHYTETVHTFDNGHALQGASEGDYQAPDQVQWANDSGGITTTAVLSGSQYFVAVGDNTWTMLPGGARERARQLAWTLIAQGQDVTLVDRDPPTDPDPTIHLTFTLPLKNLPLEPRPWKIAQGEVWLGQSDHRVHAFKLYAFEPTYETTERFFLSAFDAPVSIRLPSSAPPAPALSGQLLYSHRAPLLPNDSKLRLRDLGTGDEMLLPDVRGAVDAAAWSADGRQAICSAGGNLFLVNLDTARVVSLGRGRAPVWSADGSALFFVRGTGLRATPWTSDPLLNAPRRIGDLFVQQMDLAPDGTHLVASGWPPGSNPETEPPQLFVLGTDGSRVTPLARVPGGATEPRWSVDGTQIALIAGGHLAVADADGSNLVLWNDAGRDSSPVWSPDGSALAYGHRDSPAGPARILVRPGPGSPLQVLTAGDDVPLDWK